MLKISPIQRATGLLAIIFLLGGVCWLDTLDLTDDVLQSQPLMFGLQVIESEEEDRDLVLSSVSGALAVWLVSTVGLSLHSPPFPLARLVSLVSDRPLYQSFCTYRI